MPTLPHTPNSHTQRLLVIGAGPAGLAAAHFLHELGYDDVSIVDAAPAAGGQCHSTLARGVHFDLGPRYAHYGYVTVREMAERYGISWQAGPTLALADLQRGRLGRLGLPERKDLKTLAALGRLASVLASHRGLWHAGFLRFDHTLAMPARAWLEHHRLLPLADVLLPPLAGYGLGDPDQVPAGYLVKMLTHIVARNPLDNARWAAQVLALQNTPALDSLFNPLLCQEGFDALCGAMAERLAPRLGAVVSEVATAEHGVDVTIDGSREHFDAVIVAVPPARVVDIVAHDAVRSVFGLVRSEPLHSLLVEADGFADHEAWFLAGAQPVRRGHAVQVADTHPGTGLLSVLAYGSEGLSMQAIEGNVRGDLKSLGCTVGNVVAHHCVEAAPHAPSAHFVEFHERLETLQGLGGLYFTGEICNGGSLEGAMAYSRSLVTRFF